jgi:hypothetical protein
LRGLGALNPVVVVHTPATWTLDKVASALSFVRRTWKQKGPDTFFANKCIRPLFQECTTGIDQSSQDAVMTRFSGGITAKMIMR